MNKQSPKPKRDPKNTKNGLRDDQNEPKAKRRIFVLPKSPVSGKTALATFWSLPLLLTCGFWIWAANASATPQPIRDLFYLDPREAPEPAPAGLELINVDYEFVTLDDGARVLSIAGEVFNTTLESFKKVTLDSRFYNENNQEINRLKVQLRNGLSTAKLQALKQDAIQSLQQQAAFPPVELEPSVSIPFRIVLTEITGEEAWFSARLYSVEP